MKPILLALTLLIVLVTVNTAQNYPCDGDGAIAGWSTSLGRFNCTTAYGAGTAGVPSGMITMRLSGACPAGWTEAAALNGVTIVGTVAANADVGTTGGNNTITPAGTVSAPTFTGSALAAHAHELPWQIPSTTTIRQIASAAFGTGTSRAATAVSAAGTANTTSAAVALSQSVSAGTPTGTNSAPTFTGSAFDNRSAFVRAIFCTKN